MISAYMDQLAVFTNCSSVTNVLLHCQIWCVLCADKRLLQSGSCSAVSQVCSYHRWRLSGQWACLFSRQTRW